MQLPGYIGAPGIQMEQPGNITRGIMHPETQAELEKILIMLDKKGERATFAYLRKLLKKGTY